MKAKENFLGIEPVIACRRKRSGSSLAGRDRSQAVTTVMRSRCYRSMLGFWKIVRTIWPVATLKPNDFGLFDMQGNAYDWCYDNSRSNDYPPIDYMDVVVDAEETSPVVNTSRRAIRGGGYKHPPSYIRSAHRNYSLADSADSWRGLRPVRTLPSSR